MRRLKPKYSGPRHPWEKNRIEEEAKLKEKYAFKNKKELWKMKSILTNLRKQARSLIARKDTKQGKLEIKQLLDKCYRLGLLPKNSKLDDVLGLNIVDILERRLQTIVFKKNLSKTIKHARQLIVHGKVYVGDKKIVSPSKLVDINEEKEVRVIGNDRGKEKGKE